MLAKAQDDHSSFSSSQYLVYPGKLSSSQLCQDGTPCAGILQDVNLVFGELHDDVLELGDAV